MAPNPRVKAAFMAMKALGISEEKVKPVLKKLLKLYDKNWELIEEESYRALVDAIFEEEDNAGAEPAKKRTCDMEEDDLEEETPGQELQRPLKRLRKNQETQALSSPTNGTSGLGESPLVQPTTEGGSRTPSAPQSSMKGKQIVSPKALVIRDNADSSWPQLPSTVSDPRDKGKSPVYATEANKPRQKGHDAHSSMQLKDEPYGDEVPLPDGPISMILPGLPTQGDSVTGKEKDGGDGNGHVASPCVDEKSGCATAASSREKKINHESKNTQDDTCTSIDIASSALGEVKITLSCNSAFGGSDYHIPSLDAVLKLMEDKCLRTYKILDPSFSVMNLMKDMCQCFLELGTDSHDESREQSVNVEPTLNVLKKPFVQDSHNLKGNNPKLHILSSVSGTGDTESSMEVDAPRNVQNNHVEASRETTINKGNSLNQPEEAPQNLKLIAQDHLSPDNLRSLSHVKDISKGEERIRISWTNEVNNQCPQPFHYIPQSIVYEGALVNITLSGIKDEDCCSSCLGNCLSSPTPCACSCTNGDEFVYNVRGLLKEWFLETCISMKHDPEKRCYFNCHECPLERSKQSDFIGQCKGHLKRKFIKECWKKCGCGKHCGNRVIQQGISCRLQVFMTPEGKGWGLRTFDDIPKGTFVCEYVGEILTNKELYERKKKTNEGEHSYEVFLDSDWGSITQDDEALCLDATYYGNAARFINHRCCDANLIEIPVKVETPKHHYYHLAFFTTRKVQALEELTWDYGIDFDDHSNWSRSFQCYCQSEFCRNKKCP